MKRLKSSNETNKKNYDKKHSKPGKFKANALVLKLDFKRKKTKERIDLWVHTKSSVAFLMESQNLPP